MRRMIVLVLVFAACGKTYNCEKLTGNVTLHVVDATTGMAIAAPSFAADGLAIESACWPPTDGGEVCTSWSVLVVGRHVISVSAQGHAAVTLTLDGGLEDSSCRNQGWTNRIEQTVLLPPG